MKSFASGDVVPGCTARFEAPSEGESLRHVAQHARDDHGLSDLPESRVGAVRSRIVHVDG